MSTRVLSEKIYSLLLKLRFAHVKKLANQQFQQQSQAFTQYIVYTVSSVVNSLVY